MGWNHQLEKHDHRLTKIADLYLKGYNFAVQNQRLGHCLSHQREPTKMPKKKSLNSGIGIIARWWFQFLLFSSLFGKMIQFD